MERTGIITFQGVPLTLLGNVVEKGQKAPSFTVLSNALQPKSLADYAGKTLILSVVPSLDSGVCDTQTRRFNVEAGSLGGNVQILTISCDLPFAQSRWCGAAGVSQLETLSDYKDLSFGMAYGVAIKELRLLARSLFVVDKNGLVTYTQKLPEMTNAVDFEAALTAAKAAL